MDHPVKARTETVFRFEVEDAAVSPVFAERPEHIAAGCTEQRLGAA
jgi:hypothetical protein